MLLQHLQRNLVFNNFDNLVETHKYAKLVAPTCMITMYGVISLCGWFYSRLKHRSCLSLTVKFRAWDNPYADEIVCRVWMQTFLSHQRDASASWYTTAWRHTDFAISLQCEYCDLCQNHSEDWSLILVTADRPWELMTSRNVSVMMLAGSPLMYGFSVLGGLVIVAWISRTTLCPPSTHIDSIDASSQCAPC